MNTGGLADLIYEIIYGSWRGERQSQFIEIGLCYNSSTNQKRTQKID